MKRPAPEANSNDWPSALVKLFPEGIRTSVDDVTAKQDLEAKLLTRLPDSLVVFLRGLAARQQLQMQLGEFRWLTLDAIGAAWEQQLPWATVKEVAEEVAGETDERISRVTYHRQRVPIAEFNGDVWIYLDNAPTSLGSVGQVIQVDPEGLSWFWLASSFDRLLIDLADGRVLDPDAGTEE